MGPVAVTRDLTSSIFEGTLTGSGTRSVQFLLEGDSILASLFVRSLAAGTIAVKLYTLTREGEEKEVIAFPVVSGPTAALLLEKAAEALSNMRLEIVHTGTCELQVTGKGITVGEISASITGTVTVTGSVTNPDTELGTSSDTLNFYNEVSAVASGSTVDVVTYTVPVGMYAFLIRAAATGNNIATYMLELNGSNIDKRRTWFNGPMSELFEFHSGIKNGLKLLAGDVVKVRVNNFRPTTGDFEGRIEVVEVTP